MEAFTHRERPELSERVDSADVWPEYNRHGDVANRFWRRMIDELPAYQFVLVEGEEVLAEGHTVPIAWDGTVEGLPAGLDGALEGAFGGTEPNTLCAMAIEILPEHQSRRLSVPMLEQMKAIAAREGFDALLAPLRPSWKERYPLTPIERYVAWTRDDGLPFDPGLRVHVRRSRGPEAGARVAADHGHGRGLGGLDGYGVSRVRRIRLSPRPGAGRDRPRGRPRPLLGAERVDSAPRVAVAALVALAAIAATSGASTAATPSMTLSPQSGEAFFGVVRAVGPPEATRAELRVRGGRRRVAGVADGRVVFRLPPGRYDLSVRFLARGRLLARARADGVRALPNGAQKSATERGRDAQLSAELGGLGAEFAGYSAFWLHRLRTGEVAGWNADASFPAASLVKLGLLVAALDRYGAEPADPGIAKEIRDLAVWSSNLASNRLLIRLGGTERAGSELVTRVLWRLGATSSTFSGFYRLGTSVARDAPRAPPFITYRRTTAHDMGRVLFQLHAAALGRREALARTRLSRHEARVALGLLLASDPRGDNLGLFRPVLPAVPMAQKHGWTTSVRHSIAIVYGPGGPTILVVLMYRTRLPLADARELARRFVALARP